jgi:hypothetical protein
MPKIIKSLSVKISNHARSIYSLLLEGEDVTNGLIYTGSGWVLNLKEFLTKDDDLDVAALLKGDPGIKAIIVVEGNGLNPKTTTETAEFEEHGYAHCELEIKTEKDEN